MHPGSILPCTVLGRAERFCGSTGGLFFQSHNLPPWAIVYPDLTQFYWNSWGTSSRKTACRRNICPRPPPSFKWEASTSGKPAEFQQHPFGRGHPQTRLSVAGCQVSTPSSAKAQKVQTHNCGLPLKLLCFQMRSGTTSALVLDRQKGQEERSARWMQLTFKKGMEALLRRYNQCWVWVEEHGRTKLLRATDENKAFLCQMKGCPNCNSKRRNRHSSVSNVLQQNLSAQGKIPSPWKGSRSLLSHWQVLEPRAAHNLRQEFWFPRACLYVCFLFQVKEELPLMSEEQRA